MARGGKGTPNPRKGHKPPKNHPWLANREYFHSKQEAKKRKAECEFNDMLEQIFNQSTSS